MNSIAFELSAIPIPRAIFPAWVKVHAVDIIKTSKRVEIYNHPFSFDIETTSMIYEGRKVSVMYAWVFGACGSVTLGRTWKEWRDLYDTICEVLELRPDKLIYIYVHNLGFEFQAMRGWFTWESVFALKSYKPISAKTVDGVEFRCSYLLTGCSLAELAGKCRKYPCRKKEGDLDYTKLRHSGTPLTELEWSYVIWDGLIVMAYIQEQIEDSRIDRIPKTKTGYVRKYVRDCCLYEGSHQHNASKYLRYHRLMECLSLTVEEYQQAKRAFAGGFTHASAWHSGELRYGVWSADFTSAYPAAMVAFKFPMSRGVEVHVENEEQLRCYLKTKCCLFDVILTNVESTTCVEHPISASKCWRKVNVVEDNGRVVSADEIALTITEQDFSVFERFYKWDGIKLNHFRIYEKDYLPRDFVLAILNLYEKKTMLKGVEGAENDYMRSKEMINSAYGMAVTDILREEISYTGGDWNTLSPAEEEIAEKIEKYNNSKNRFLSYLWGLWVTAYCRRNLFTGIWELQGDYIYSDTDSVKYYNREKHVAYFDRFNAWITECMRTACEVHGIDFAMTRPKTKDGVEKPLGVWDDEGQYEMFKTLGAKRYMVRKGGKTSLTVSGVNKKIAVPYLLRTYGEEGIFDAFNEDLEIPPEYTGKLTHTYINEEERGEFVDYLGNVGEFYEKSGTHLGGAGYSFSLSAAYINYLRGIREEVS